MESPGVTAVDFLMVGLEEERRFNLLATDFFF